MVDFIGIVTNIGRPVSHRNKRGKDVSRINMQFGD